MIGWNAVFAPAPGDRRHPYRWKPFDETVTRVAELNTQGIVKLVPPHKRDCARSILRALSLTLYWWLIGRLASD